jgi:hypothetical protein
MKLVSTLVITAAALTMPAIAMAKDCGSLPARLQLPNGATASEDEMKATASKFPPYAQAVSAYMRCHNDEVKSAKDEYDAVAADWAKQQAAFKNAAPK